jgi:hypothetical protein
MDGYGKTGNGKGDGKGDGMALLDGVKTVFGTVVI